MKLSAMNTEQLCNALCALTQPVCALLDDPQVQAAMASILESGLEAAKPAQAWSALIANLTPVLLQRRRQETLLIASALLDRPVQQLRAENGLAVIAALRDCWDEELAGFFACAAGTVSKLC